MSARIKPGGLAQYFGEYGVTERHASTCAHCQYITEFDSLKEMREHVDVCRGCMRLICLKCARKPCLPWEKQCQAAETEAIRSRVELEGWRCY